MENSFLTSYLFKEKFTISSYSELRQVTSQLPVCEWGQEVVRTPEPKQ